MLLINPGEGASRGDGEDENHRVLIDQFRSGLVPIESIFDHQRGDIKNWGRGRFVSFYESLGLNICDLAIANVAWCGTKGNRYPASMLNDCFKLHTAPLIKELRPDVVLLGGTRVHPFEESVRLILPYARLVLTPHYAHRKGGDYQRTKSERIKAEMAS